MKNMSENNTIAIDFDGVIHKYSKGWQDGSIYDEPVDGVKEALLELSKEYELVVFTARSDLKSVVNWIAEHLQLGIIVTNQKPPALAYIDDRGIRFTNWSKTLEELKKNV